MRKAFTLLAALLCLASVAQADVFNLGPGLTNLETVPVGDPGNSPDTRYASPGYGSVGYNYRIGKFEVTAAQYCEFLNHAARTDPYELYVADMRTSLDGCKIQQSGVSGNYSYSVPADYADAPVNWVSFWDACRFANWLHNGQGEGDTETGAYTLNGYTGQDGRAVSRNPGAKWFIPSEDEWYKAAHYKNGAPNAGYWDYPTQSDSIDISMANYAGSVGATTWVGSYPHPSGYGTFDQGGNVWEWNEAVRVTGDVVQRGRRGDWFGGGSDLHAACRSDKQPTEQSAAVGFRIASIPEPSSILALLCGLGGLAWRKKTSTY